MVQGYDIVVPLRSVKTELPKIKIPVGIYGKDRPKSSASSHDWEEGSQKERNQYKIEDAKQLLGTWWRLHKNSTFVSRGEFFLTIYNRHISGRKPDVSLISGKVILVAELRELLSNLDQNRRVYIGDLKLMGD